MEQKQENVVTHRGKQYTIKRITLKDFIPFKKFCEEKIDMINLLKIENDEDLRAASADWDEFTSRAFENPDEDLKLENMTGSEVKIVETDFFLRYSGYDPTVFKEFVDRLSRSQETGSR